MSKRYTIHGTFDSFKSDETKLSPEKIKRLRENDETNQERIRLVEEEEREFRRIQRELGIKHAQEEEVYGEGILVTEDEVEGGEEGTTSSEH